jgi:hypothetical protein
MSPRAPAQVGDAGAPWRLSAEEIPDLTASEPINLNRATLDELMLIPGLDPAIAQAILDFRKLQGRAISLEELKRSGIINDDIFDNMQPFTKVMDEPENWQYRVMASYGADDPPGEVISKSPYRQGFKLALEKEGSLSLGMALEKDAGETDIWDHSAMGLAYELPGNRGRIVLGDYLASYGFGMLINTRRSYSFLQQFGGLFAVRHPGITTYRGFDESIALRGVALQAEAERWRLAAWGSSRKRDAYVDSLGVVTAFDLSGKHRTAAEQEREGNCTEDLFGGRIEYAILPERMNIACTGYLTSWDRAVRVGQVLYDQVGVGSVELNACVDQFRGRAEIALDDRGGTAAMLGVSAKLSDFSANGALYRAGAGYFSPLSSTMDLDIGRVRNRQGVLAVFQAWSQETKMMMALHLHRRLERTVGESWGGQDLFAQLRQGFSNKVETALSSRWTQEEETADTIQTSHWRGSCALRILPSPDWEMQLKLKLCRANGSAKAGSLLQMEICRRLELDSHWTLKGNSATGIYYAPDYGVRLYWSDVRLDGSWQNRAFWGRGAFWALELKGGYGNQCTLELFALWDMPERDFEREFRRSIWLTLKIQG